MLNLIKTIFVLSFWDNIDIVEQLCETKEKMKSKCNQCDLFACSHIRYPKTSIISIGDQSEDLMEKFSCGKANTFGPPAPIEKKLRISDTINTELQQAITEPKRILMLPPAKKQEDSKIEPQSTMSLSNAFPKCSICNGNVKSEYLTKHLLVHTIDYSKYTSNAIKTTHNVVHTPPSTAMVPRRYIDEVPKKKNVIPRLSRIIPFSFNDITACSFTSSATKSGKHSHITLIFWSPEKAIIKNGSHVGAKSYATKEWDRFSITLAYDSKEEFYIITSKSLTRSSFSSFDKETSIPDRICFQEELETELKRIFLHFKIDPKKAASLFNDALQKEYVISTDEDDKTIQISSENYPLIDEILHYEAGLGSSRTPDDDAYHGCYGM